MAQFEIHVVTDISGIMSKCQSQREILGSLPDLRAIEKLSQSLAVLDAILSPNWEGRYFSFNSKWDSSKNERMASMRNGSGDEYFLVLSPQGGFLKGFDHEAEMSPWGRNPQEVWPGVLDSVPSPFSSLLDEPAFSMESTTFCLWRSPINESWQRG